MSSRPSRGAARLASILDALPDALLLVNANGTVVNANAIALETFEAPGTALVGRGLLDLLPSFDPKRIPGSMRSPREAVDETRTKPTRMLARRTDGTEFPVQVTSANLDDSRTPYADYGDGMPHYTGDELLMLVVRDLSGTVDTEAELARQQRQTEMILRAAAEGVVGVDTAGKVVLVNPSAAQILGHRATDLGGKELHPLVHHSRPDGSPLAYEETPLADTLRSGRKHRVRGQVLWRKDGRAVPVDLTTAPVRDGDQLVGAVMTFTDRTQYDALAARTGQLRSLLDTSLRGPLAELRAELTGLAADPAGQLWPEANQILHHLSAGYARITTLIDNVLDFQRLDRGEDKLHRTLVGLDDVVTAAVEGAVELIGPGRAQFAVHAAPIEASVDGPRMAQALAHLVADVAGVDASGNAVAFAGDSTIVVAVAQRGDAVRIDVRGPSAGGDPVHLPLARGIIERHGGVLQTHEVPGQGSAYVLEVPLGPVPDGSRSAAADSADAAGSADPSGSAGPAGFTDARGGEPGDGTQGLRATGVRGGAHSGGKEVTGGRAGARGRTGPGSHAGAADGPVSATGPGGNGSGRDATGRPANGSAGTPGGGARPGSDGPVESDGPLPPRPGQHVDDTGTVFAPWAIPPAADQSEAPTGRRRALRRPEGRPDGQAEFGPEGRPEGRSEGRSEERPEGRPQGRPQGLAENRSAAGPEERREGRPTGGQQDFARPGAPNGPGPLEAAPPTGRRARRGRPAVEEQPGNSGADIRELPAPRVPHALPPADSGAGADGGRDTGRADGAAGPGGVAGPSGPGTPVDPAPGTGRRGRRLQAAPPPSVPGLPYQEGPADGGRPRPPAQTWPEPGAQADPRPQAAPGPRALGPAPAPGTPGRPAVPPQPPAAAWPDPESTARGGQPARPAPTSWPPAGVQNGPAQNGPARNAPAHDDPAHEGPVQNGPHAQGTPHDNPAPHAPGQGHDPQNAHGAPGSAPGGRGAQQDPSQQSHGRPISVRTLGQSAPFGTEPGGQTPTQAVQAQHPQGLPAQVAAGGSGRRRRLAAPQPSNPQQQDAQGPQPTGPQPVLPNQQSGPGGEHQARQHPQADPDSGQLPVRRPDRRGPAGGDREAAPLRPVPSVDDPQLQAPGRSYAIGAPAEGAAEGPEPLDGPNGAVDVTDVPARQDNNGTAEAADDRREEPLEEPRRLLVWPEPDVSTRQALTDRGYRPVIVRSREEVDAQVAEPPAALFVDPLTGPITRTALQSLRQAAAAAEVPVLVTAGLGQATREAAYGADPAVLLKALAPRDSEQHPPRVLLVEGHDPIATAFAATLERRGMQVTHADSESDAMTKAAQIHPNLVVMDLMLIRRRRQGIVDWLRGHSRLNSTPLVVYTSADIDPAELPRLASGETVLFLAERSTSTDVQSRIVDLLGKIGA